MKRPVYFREFSGVWCCAMSVPPRQPVWRELEYRIDVCRVTRGAHIKHL